jgi:DEAD/DEAH box helicase domain-containing protein
MSLDSFLQQTLRAGRFREAVAEQRRLPPVGAAFAPDDFTLQPATTRMLAATGIDRIYRHQAEAIEAVRNNENVVLSTGTASGKSLCYTIPAFESIITDPASRALLLFPTKALAQDQLRSMRSLADSEQSFKLRAGVYDGDTPQSARGPLRREANLILSNPDMLHTGILPNHNLRHWQFFFRNLKLVVIDEIHGYRGVFGSHVANVIRRLRRVCRLYANREPVFVCCSATIGNPAELAERLTGLPQKAIADDGAPRSERIFVFWNPPADPNDGRKPGALEEGGALLREAVAHGVRTIAFVPSRMSAERLARQAGSIGVAAPVSAYRSGYLPEERRQLERDLASGELQAVVSTTALELGIDVGSLDLCLLCGYPGSVAATWQRAGRAGRRDAPSLTVLLADNSPTDQYIANHPDFFFGSPAERAVVNPENPLVLKAHLAAASAEVPLSVQDTEFFPLLDELLPEMLDTGQLGQVDTGLLWRGDDHPAGAVSLRSASQAMVIIQDKESGEEVGTVEKSSAGLLVHPGAVYLHLGELFLVSDLDLEKGTATVTRQDPGYMTRPITEVRLDLGLEIETRSLPKSGTRSGVSKVIVTSRVTGFRKFGRRAAAGLAIEPLDLPESSLETEGVWLAINDPMAAEGLAYLLERTLPLFAMCDARDVNSGVVTLSLPGTLSPDGISLPSVTTSVVIYDLHPGGIGFARQGFNRLEDWLTASLDVVERCDCRNGCPACVGSEEGKRDAVQDALVRLAAAVSG